MAVTAVASVAVTAVPDEGARRRAGADRQNRAAVKPGRGQVPVIKLVFPGLRINDHPADCRRISDDRRRISDVGRNIARRRGRRGGGCGGYNRFRAGGKRRQHTAKQKCRKIFHDSPRTVKHAIIINGFRAKSNLRL